MMLLIILMSVLFSIPVAFAFRGYGPRAMTIAGIVNFLVYMAGLWFLGAFD